MAQRRDRQTLCLAERSRNGTRGARRRGRLALPVGDAPPEMVPITASVEAGTGAGGSVAPNAYGLYNLGDNVHEWCADWYDDGYYARLARTKSARAEERHAPGFAGAARGATILRSTRTAGASSIPPEFQYAD